MNLFQTIVIISGGLIEILTVAALMIKPIRKKIFEDSAARNGQKCLLRSEILRTYYRNLEAQTLRQYEYQNLVYCYEAYKALGGNSFIDKIYKEMQTWKIVT